MFVMLFPITLADNRVTFTAVKLLFTDAERNSLEKCETHSNINRYYCLSRKRVIKFVTQRQSYDPREHLLRERGWDYYL